MKVKEYIQNKLICMRDPQNDILRKPLPIEAWLGLFEVMYLSGSKIIETSFKLASIIVLGVFVLAALRGGASPIACSQFDLSFRLCLFFNVVTTRCHSFITVTSPPT